MNYNGSKLSEFQKFVEAPSTPEQRETQRVMWRDTRIMFAAASNRPIEDFSDWPPEDLERLKARRIFNDKLRLLKETPGFQKYRETWTKAEINLTDKDVWEIPEDQ